MKGVRTPASPRESCVLYRQWWRWLINSRQASLYALAGFQPTDSS